MYTKGLIIITRIHIYLIIPIFLKNKYMRHRSSFKDCFSSLVMDKLVLLKCTRKENVIHTCSIFK